MSALSPEFSAALKEYAAYLQAKKVEQIRALLAKRHPSVNHYFACAGEVARGGKEYIVDGHYTLDELEAIVYLARSGLNPDDFIP